MDNSAPTRQVHRKLPACNECKRRKVRCSGGENCSNCRRDGKTCAYSSPLIALSATERRLGAAERTIDMIKKAWSIHLPNVDLEDALKSLDEDHDSIPGTVNGVIDVQPLAHASTISSATQPSQASPAEASNAEDYEFDESQDFDNTTDGMGFLVAEPGKAGYMGPQSGVAAVKFLQSLHLYPSLSSTSTTSLDEPDTDLPSASATDIARYMDDYFRIYHTAYPILHEGTFRARVSGALRKPRDGSWPLLHSIVLAIGAFVGATKETNSDIPFYRKARASLNMDVLEKGSLSYVQGLVLMANYLQKRNKPNAGFVLIGIGFSMALAIGLHREFGLPHSSPFTMEIRRRVWWVLFIFVSGAQLTLGRPPVSLVGVNVHLPSNLDDAELAVDMESLPSSQKGPTVTSCLIYQVKLAIIANMVQVELLTDQITGSSRGSILDQKITKWRAELPAHFDDGTILEPWFEVPKRILIWRSLHLRIILHRPAIFQQITAKVGLDQTIPSIHACLAAAEECVESICHFVNLEGAASRGLAWYATYWLITASFVQATCYIYNPVHILAEKWHEQLQQAVICLAKLGQAHGMALRARDILLRLLEQSNPASESGGSSNAMFNIGQEAAMDFWQLNTPRWPPFPYSSGQTTTETRSTVENMTFPWYAEGSADAELLDATGAIMLQVDTNSADSFFGHGSWMPG
ncbi:hypothetical protein IQ07DRAFT_640775 [Pyrenochaeta sp. DS3sAY3a]|nr:hypothetical protein IQ07DRAFT_640775 [Pyrenochaeta sp. DS3sAY3a]